MAEKILIVDDEPDVVKILGMRLKANGYQIIAAHDGAAAIELAHYEKPDLIILDIKMPGTDGYSVFEEIKASASTMSIPIVFFSALPPEQVQETPFNRLYRRRQASQKDTGRCRKNKGRYGSHPQTTKKACPKTCPGKIKTRNYKSLTPQTQNAPWQSQTQIFHFTP